MEGIKYMIETIYDKVEELSDCQLVINNDDNEDEEEPEVEEDESEEETENTKYKIVEYKDTEYIVEDNIIYKIKEDNGVMCKGSKVGTWNDGKVKKGIKKDTTIDV